MHQTLEGSLLNNGTSSCTAESYLDLLITKADPCLDEAYSKLFSYTEGYNYDEADDVDDLIEYAFWRDYCDYVTNQVQCVKF